MVHMVFESKIQYGHSSHPGTQAEQGAKKKISKCSILPIVKTILNTHVHRKFQLQKHSLHSWKRTGIPLLFGGL